MLDVRPLLTLGARRGSAEGASSRTDAQLIQSPPFPGARMSDRQRAGATLSSSASARTVRVP
jgi:hypothetical protein